MARVTLDDVDFKILKQLDKDGDIDAEKLSDELDVSKSTIYYRMEKYREKGIIEGEITQISPQKIGLGLTTITEIDAHYDGPEYEEVAKTISELSGVQRVFFMLGEMSFYVISRVQNHDQLQNLMENIIQIDGVNDSTTNIVLRTFKNEDRLLVNYDDEDLKKLFED